MRPFTWKAALGATLSAGLLAAPMTALPAYAEDGGAAVPGIVINEAYLSGGSANAPFTNKFVELYNPTGTDVSLDGWSLQYRSAGSTAAPTGIGALAGTIPAGGYYLISGASNGAFGAPLPAADATVGASFSGSGGTLVLSSQATRVDPLPAGSVTGTAGVVDLLGYGTSNTFETAAAAAPAGNADPKSLNRTGFTDSNNNAADFTLSANVTPTGTGSPAPGEPDPTPTPTPEPSPTTPANPPGDAIPIAAIQGPGEASPLIGQTVTTRGKVTGVYPTGGFNGYYLQTPGTGGTLDPAGHTASDGIFVYSADTVGSVAAGDYVEVTGSVGEYFGLTQLTVAAGNLTRLDEPAEEVKAASVTWPANEVEREALEGMLLAPQGSFTVTDNYSLNQYAEIGLAAGTSPLVQPTAVAAVGTPEHAAVVADNAARAVKLDDGASTNFLSAANQGIPLPYLTPENPVRIGAAAAFTTGVILDFRNSAWKFQPLTALTAANAAEATPASFEATRTAAPESVGGNLKLASFNVLNYFSTTGDTLAGCTYYTDRAGAPLTVRGGCDARGAANAENLDRQQAKIVAAINALGADVVSLMEVENSAAFGKDRDEALAHLTAALNEQAPGTWDYVRSPAALPDAEDVIRTAFIFRTATAEPVGESVILNDEAIFSNAREPLAQAFKPAGGSDSETLLAISNHFKSKGSAPDSGENADTGQGGWNADRVRQAQALVSFADTASETAGTEKVFLLGDFNSYAAEDPMRVLADAGYVNLGKATGKHSYAFSGLVGSLDHVLASGEAAEAVTGADIWNINSVESLALEYSRFNTNVTNYYAPDPYRSSDHDPILVGLDLSPAGAETEELNLLNINDFHGRIDDNTVNFAGTVEQLKAAAPEGSSLFLSAGDNIGASLFASSVQQDKPTLDVLNALELQASAVGNHEFDAGFADLTDRVAAAADFPYLGANVYLKGTTTPALDEYTILDVNGVSVAVIGAITEETPTLVSPGGIADLDFGDPVEAVNRVAEQLQAAGLADVIVAEYHEGAGSGSLEESTLEQELAAGGTFAEIVNGTSALVDAIYTGHTHKQYAWDAPVPGGDGKTRPVLQTGSYGEFIGQINLDYNPATDEVVSYTATNVPRTTESAASLVSAYPAVAEVKSIVDTALAYSAEVGNEPVGSVTADITTAFTGTTRDDRSAESTLGNLVADSLLSTLSTADRGGAEIGVTNPGGLRAELYYGDDGVITYAEANAVLPFVNNLWTTTLTGAQLKTMLEQQWQPAGSSRPFLALGLSDNITYTFDPAQAAGSRISTVTVNGEALDPTRAYRVGTFSFLAQGGDNFTVFNEGTDTRDSGLVDRDAWISYIEANSPLSPDFARQGVVVQGAPAAAAPGAAVSFTVSGLDLTSLGSPVNTGLAVSWVDAAGTATPLGTSAVTAGTASVNVTVPASAAASGRLVLTADSSGTTVTLPVTVEAPTTPPAPVCTAPVPPKNWWDVRGWLRYTLEWARYLVCLSGR
ncbi:ExeM/NucH family extracellular endonuclease [Arthrobacter sp. zg-Y820]|uniref:ExeM/NucH family extracellular endonuclease n=1 Tax=unclassified Arthrobacter TaxID=235627 RepID=UPI001E35CB2C|nr:MULTISPECIES: ExeM/NucH family extracellular endonuclease [unclassified Arthrobacter]MCC9198374.1 ExeM/NucH family extracellular endonuclease [Arthrobacter sp. zg-Y820]MDK1281244.1 ExeM/NucH family extracellular endonuclease [Arthrobacter sp. zg.Y820]WIB09831.1 ExeM/NucH family extracellular endonuclease [Arthrobacter sp. zg-Y820]